MEATTTLRYASNTKIIVNALSLLNAINEFMEVVNKSSVRVDLLSNLIAKFCVESFNSGVSISKLAKLHVTRYPASIEYVAIASRIAYRLCGTRD